MRRIKFLCFLLLGVSLLAWIVAWSNTPIRSLLVSPASYVIQRHETVKDSRDSKETEKVKLDEQTQDQVTPEELCPEKSPQLRGAVVLQFKPSLTFNQVAEENRAVTEGEYKPNDCTARQSVAILIPHRNREKHLLYLLHHLHPFLQRQQLHYGIYIIHQAGEVTFNRAKLLNVGYLEALKDYDWDCFIFHDVDLIPENDYNLYTCEKQPKHLVVGRNSTGYKLRYKGYFGGVTAMSKEQFSKVNGFPNTYWGWGGEDDDLRIRVNLQGMNIIRPPANVARYTMVFHKRDNGNQVNKNRMQLLGRTSQMWRKDGLNSCSYETLSIERPPLYINITVDIGKP